MKKIFIVTCFLSLMLFTSSAMSLTIPLDYNFTDYNSGIFGNVVIDDAGNNVKFTITINDKSSGSGTKHEDLQDFYFNYGGSAPLSWTWSILSCSVTLKDIGGITDTTITPSLSTGLNAFKADGDGSYDGLVNFGNGGPKIQYAQFTLVAPTNTTPYNLDPNDFYFNSQLEPGNGLTFYTAVHLQNTNNTAGSLFAGSTAVPLPGAVLLLGAGLARFGGLRPETPGRVTSEPHARPLND